MHSATSGVGRLVTKAGVNTTTLTGNNTYSGGTTVNGGTLTTSTNFSNGTLNVQTGTAIVTPKQANNSAAGLTRVPKFTMGSIAKMDIANNAMIVAYGADSSPVDEIRNHIKDGFFNGTWTGLGLTSSTAAANASAAVKTAIGYAEGSTLMDSGVASVAGYSLTGQELVLKYTIFGDANLDGKVNALDFNAPASGFGTGSIWTMGDFNYDGAVDSSDFTALATNFNQTTPTPAPSLGALVPEPASLALMIVGNMLIVRRRWT